MFGDFSDCIASLATMNAIIFPVFLSKIFQIHRISSGSISIISCVDCVFMDVGCLILLSLLLVRELLRDCVLGLMFAVVFLVLLLVADSCTVIYLVISALVFLAYRIKCDYISHQLHSLMNKPQRYIDKHSISLIPKF